MYKGNQMRFILWMIDFEMLYGRFI